jgi:hypothetical protein
MNGGESYEGEIIRVANAIRKEQGVPDPETQHRVFPIYYFKLLHPDAATTRFINAVSPAEHVATFRWLFDGYALDESNSRLRSYYLSALEEATGQRDEALAGYRLIQQQTVPSDLFTADTPDSERIVLSADEGRLSEVTPSKHMLRSVRFITARVALVECANTQYGSVIMARNTPVLLVMKKDKAQWRIASLRVVGLPMPYRDANSK